MWQWLLARSLLPFAPNPRTLLWQETAWALASAGLLYLGLRSNGPAWLLASAGLSLWAWIQSRRHYRQIADIPTAKLASAPQGYVEVSGTGRIHPDYPITSPLTGLPCLWYQYTVWRTDGDRNQIVDSGTSEQPFALDDGSCLALVLPESARVITRHVRTWRNGDYRYHECLLRDNEPIYVLGEHVDSLRGRGGRMLDNRRNAMLAEWKLDQDALKKRFDADANGVIDSREWEAARRAAEAEVMRNASQSPDKPEIGFLRRPADGRPLLLSNYPAGQLAARFRRWSWLHLGVFVAALLVFGAR